MLRSSNPALSDKAFAPAFSSGETMTINGVVHRTAFLLLILLGFAAFSWSVFAGQGPASVSTLVAIGAIAGLIIGFVTIAAPKFAPFTAPMYAACQGLAVGSISAMYDAQFTGLPAQAVGLTAFTLLALLMAYRSGLVKATENFKLGVVAATGAICLYYLASFVLGFFSISLPLIHDNGWAGIGFSALVVVVAALNLVLDFDFIEKGAATGAPKYMEWYGAFGLLVTLIWLYLEILRLLAKARSRK